MCDLKHETMHAVHTVVFPLFELGHICGIFSSSKHVPRTDMSLRLLLLCLAIALLLHLRGVTILNDLVKAGAFNGFQKLKLKNCVNVENIIPPR